VRIKIYDQKQTPIVPSKRSGTVPMANTFSWSSPIMTTEVRKRSRARRTEGDSAIIANGLEKGEQVVTQGQLRLGAGAKVVVKS